MENGVEVFDGERKGEQDGIVKDKEAVGLVEVKESEGDEVFEEAIESETPGVVSEGGNAGYFGNVNSDSRDEVDNFEEAVEASHEIQQTDDGSHETKEAKGDQEPSVAKSENGSLDHLNLGNTQSHHDAQETIKDWQDGEVHKILATEDANEAKGGNDYVQKQVHSCRDALLGDEVNAHVIGTSNIQPAEHQDFVNVHKDVSVSSGSILKDERDIQLEEAQSHRFKLLKSDVKDKEQEDPSPNDNSTNGHLRESLNPSDEKEKSVISTEPINGSNKNEEQMDCPIDTAAPIAQIGRPGVNAEVKEEELTVAVLISQECLDEQDIVSDDVTTYQGLNETESPAVELVNLNDNVQEYIKEQEDVLNCDATDPQDLKGEESPAVALVNSNDKVQEYAEEQNDAIDHQVSTGKDSPAVNYKVQLYVEQQKDVLSSDPTDDQILNVKESPAVGLVISNDKVDEQKDVSVSCISASEDHTENSSGEMVTAEDENWKSSEGSVSNNNEKVGVSTHEFVSVSSKVSQPPLGDAIIAVKKAVAQESEKLDIKELKQNVTGVREPEAGSARDLSSSSGSSVTRTPLPARPAGLSRAAPLLEPTPRVVQQTRVNGAASSVQNQLVGEPTNGESEEYDETREKLQMIRVKFLRLAHRLGQNPHNVVVAQVLYRLGLAEQLRGRNGSRVAAFSFDRASAMAEQLEAAGQEALDFSCTIMVLGKTGVGKSATINSIFDEAKFGTDAFQIGTKKVQDVIGTVQGIKVRVIDTPGLLPSWADQRRNEKILRSVKRFIKKTSPDIVLYLDRLDMQSRDYGDTPLLRTITEVFGPSIWFNAIVVLTHAASAPPEGPNGTTTSYDMFVTQRSHVVQQAIRQAAGDMRLMNPVSLVENHLACRTNRVGQRVLPNGQVWKPHLLLLSFASKILAEANTLLKLQDSPPGQTYATRSRSPPLPFLLSSLLQSRPQVKLPADQFSDDNEILDDDLDESSDSEDESEYDQLPAFKRLTKAQLAKLTQEQKKAYNDELEYREKLFMKKQLKEVRKRRRMMKKIQAAAKDLPTDTNETVEEENGSAASVPVPMPDLALPASFDSDNPTHRYRYLDSSNQWLVRPVLEPNGWDHDVGYEGINVERLFVIKDKIPLSFSSQLSKDKKDTNLQMEIASSVKHGNGKATSLGFDMQSVGKDLAYTLRGETRFSNYRKNKATAGLSVTLLGDVMTGGVKVEDKLIVNKRGLLVISGGAMFGRGDVAYGGSLEATLRDKDHPLGRFLSTLGLSVMDWHGDLAIGCNSQTQIPVGRYTNLIGRVNINNKGSGQVSIRLNSSEQLQIALISLLPLVRKLISYTQPVQFG
ncbi:translocase of chloroplast 120, chloroplastic-like [Solanum dulcamara]|uniref:translocase of chloroplast 120, chloroplastic-like n=1 Tax=Solanum dulcamara TaxID=45834 RepID=UPI002484FB7F|nr:translocase of chloroplast 120, chloroplastic-like [Solanum dulcamara]